MHKFAVVGVVVFAVIGCSKKKEDAPAAGGAPKVSTPAVTATQTPAAPSASKLTCDQVFPKPLRDKYLPGFELTEIPQPVDSSAECEMVKDGDKTNTGKVAVSCHENMKMAKAQTLEALKDMFKELKEMPGVGDPALSQDVMGLTQVTAWDSDSNCQVTLMVPKGVDASAFTKDVLAVFPLK